MSAVAAAVALVVGVAAGWTVARRTERDRRELEWMELGAKRWNEGYAVGWTDGRNSLVGELKAKVIHPTSSVHAEVVHAAQKVVDLEAWRLRSGNDGPGVA